MKTHNHKYGCNKKPGKIDTSIKKSLFINVLIGGLKAKGRLLERNSI